MYIDANELLKERESLAVLAAFAHEVALGVYRDSELRVAAKSALENAGMTTKDVAGRRVLTPSDIENAGRIAMERFREVEASRK